MREYVIVVLSLLGALFILLAALGVLRMPDLFSRMHATTKAATLGTSLIVLAVTIALPEKGSARSFAVIFFLFLTAPISAQMIGGAAYFTGAALWKGTHINELSRNKDKEGTVDSSS